MCDEGSGSQGSRSPVWEPAKGQAVSTDGTRKEAQSRVQAVSGQGEKAVQKSHKVKRIGLLARGEQSKTEEIQTVMLLVTFELEVVILILEMTKSRLTKTQ